MKTKNILQIAAVASFLSASGFATAAEFDFVLNPVQSDFREVSEDLAAALNFKALAPAEASGLTGFSVGAFASYTPVDNKDAWRNLTGESVEEVGLVGLNATKGLPFGVDVGAFYSQVPGTDARIYGAEGRYAILKGGIATPALAIRTAYTKMTGVDDFDFDSLSVDLSISKGFAFFTPYAGIGHVRATVDPNNQGALEKEKVEEERLFVGARFTLGLLALTPEYEHIGDNSVYSLRLSLGL